MSEELPAPGGIRLGSFCGPSDEGADRFRVQIETDGIVTLSRDAIFELWAALQEAMWEHPHPESLRARLPPPQKP